MYLVTNICFKITSNLSSNLSICFCIPKGPCSILVNFLHVPQKTYIFLIISSHSRQHVIVFSLFAFVCLSSRSCYKNRRSASAARIACQRRVSPPRHQRRCSLLVVTARLVVENNRKQLPVDDGRREPSEAGRRRGRALILFLFIVYFDYFMALWRGLFIFEYVE